MLKKWIGLLARGVVLIALASNIVAVIFLHGSGENWHYNAFWVLVFSIWSAVWEIESELSGE